ncbi:putative sister chromatid cohesion protein Pds5 [Septoria linicola]|nr:putative sister chromatid cohesion protein Pds5 [Septoria linicola]
MPRATRKRAAAQPEPEPEAEVEEQEEEQEEEAAETQDGQQQTAGGDEMDVDDEEEAEDGEEVLENDEPLTWRAGKPIAVATLLQRLKALAAELQSLEQGQCARTSLEPKAKELSNPLLLAHKDYGVQVYTLQCIVEMFRLLAPDAPYKASQLKTIFNFVISTIVPELAKPAHTYNAQHLAIITSLATVKSILLIQDLPGAEQMQKILFTNCFDVLAGNVQDGERDLLSKNVEFNFTYLLCALVDEVQTVPNEVVEVVLAQFLRADPHATTKKGETRFSEVLREVSPAYNLARSICNTCEEKMIRHIGQWFQSVLIDANEAAADTKPARSRGKKRTHDESDDESESGLVTPSADDLQEAEKAHRLLRELWRACPGVIQNVLPQVESELNTENTALRIMGVQSVGDMVAGIGAAGPPTPAALDPAAYPSQSVSDYVPPPQQNIVLIPAAPQAFSSTYPTTYQTFIDRHRDKSAQVRAAWVTACARIILTSGGGKGLDTEQETQLLREFTNLMTDNDEKVRAAAVSAVSAFDFTSVVQKLGRYGGASKEKSVLNELTARIKDPKHNIAAASIELLGRLWGVASGAIIEGNERIRELFGPIPSSILNAVYINQPTLNALISKAVFDSLLPISYPPIKSKSSGAGDSQRVPDSQGAQSRVLDPDRIRSERILALVRDLDDKSKRAFFSLQYQQVQRAKYVASCLDLSEKLGGDVKGDKEEAKRLQTMIKVLVDKLPDKTLATTHLTTFFGHNDRRNFVLTRMAISAESDYKKSRNAVAEVLKRLDGATGAIANASETIDPLLRSTAVLVYNRSHVPAIVAISRTDDNGLGNTAHEVLKEISTQAPLVFEVHIKELCETLKKQAPSASSPNDVNAEDTLKACAGFARHFPEKMPKDRDFYQAMAKFAKFGSPPAVTKHAVTVVVAAAEKKDMYVNDILKHCLKNFDVSDDSAATKLAAISQLQRMAHVQTEDRADAIHEIFTTALRNRSVRQGTDPEWSDEIDSELSVKLWALKGVVNDVRGQLLESDTGRLDKELEEAVLRLFKVLNTIVEREGELAGEPSPEHHKAQMRLAAAKLILKLCCTKAINKIFAARDFHRLTKVAQDPLPQVRRRFVSTLKKYTGQQKQLHHRFFSLMFLYAFEPEKGIREPTATFLKARAAFYAKLQTPVLENVFPYFLSLLAHHQDFSLATSDISDFVEYILFYLKAVATEQNLPDIYAYAQRARSFQDAIEPEKSDYLWTMADLAESITRAYETAKGWSLQLKSSKPAMPSSVYRQIRDQEFADEVSQKRFLPAEVDEGMEEVIRDRLKPRKRKHADGDSKRPAKKPRASTSGEQKSMAVRKKKLPKEPKVPKPAKTPKKRASDAVPSSTMRKSTRASNAHSYADLSDSEGEVDDDDIVWRYEGEESSADEANKENFGSTPPTSDPTLAAKSQDEEAEDDEIEVAEPPARTSVRKTATPRFQDRTMKEQDSAKKVAAQKKAKPQPARGGRSSARNAKKEKDIMDIPSDSE